MWATCDNCGNRFSKKYSSVQRSRHNFHNKKCYAEYRKNHPGEYRHSRKPDMRHQRLLKRLAKNRR